MGFQDRTEAGQRLAAMLKPYANRSDVLVLGLPRGGVPIAYEVAKVLNAPLDIFLVRKLGVPRHEELAMGAIASGGVRELNQEVVSSIRISHETIDKTAAEEQQELERRERNYRGNRPPLNVCDHTVILIDDGLATGASMRVAATALRQQQPKQIIAAVPVSAPENCKPSQVNADEIVCVETPQQFRAIGLWYEQFPQTSDEEVKQLLDQASQEKPTASGK